MTSLLVRAAWVCPVLTPPLADGWVFCRGDRIEAVGRGNDAPAADRTIDLVASVVLPGLVNAHTHLELSWLRGRVPPAGDFLTWVAQLMGQRTLLETADDGSAIAALRGAVAELAATGTVAVGDIANALVSPAVLREQNLSAVVFHELLGFRDADGRVAVAESLQRCAALAGSGVRVVPAAHAPFSVSRELFIAIRDAVRAMPEPISSVHVAESAEEVELLSQGTGPWRRRLIELGAWRDGWTAPGAGPGDYLCDLGVLDRGVLAVHGVQLTDAELARLAARGVTLVTCPRSNVWVGVGAPPLARFFASGVAVAVGTDSLASVPDLNLFGELAAMRTAAPEVPARRLLFAATRAGAEALQLDADVGSLEPGRRAHLVAVAVSPGISDPEEMLVSGVTPDRIGIVTPARQTVGAG
jgi:aminodeoxyfutalosine deaminase